MSWVIPLDAEVEVRVGGSEAVACERVRVPTPADFVRYPYLESERRKRAISEPGAGVSWKTLAALRLQRSSETGSLWGDASIISVKPPLPPLGASHPGHVAVRTLPSADLLVCALLRLVLSGLP